MESIEGTALSTGPQGIAAAGPVGVDHSMALQPGPLGSIEKTASSPGPQGIAVAGPAPVDHSMERQPGPIGSKVVHTFTQGLQTSAYVHPMFADVCILPALGSMVVHHAGLWIQGCAYFWPMNPWLCILPALGSMVVHHAGPAPVDRSMALQPGPLGSKVVRSSPGPQGIASCPAPMESIEGTASSPGPQL